MLVTWHSCLGYRHVGCLQLSCVQTVDPSTDGRRSAVSPTAISGGAYRLATPGGDNLLLLLLHPFNGLFSRTTWVSRYQKGKTSLHSNEARDDGVSGCSGISWTICKQSAPRFRQITTPTPHHSMFVGWRLFLTPTQQCQSTEGDNLLNTNLAPPLLTSGLALVDGDKEVDELSGCISRVRPHIVRHVCDGHTTTIRTAWQHRLTYNQNHAVTDPFISAGLGLTSDSFRQSLKIHLFGDRSV